MIDKHFPPIIALFFSFALTHAENISITWIDV